jgi:ParB family chromosome partitioning protein
MGTPANPAASERKGYSASGKHNSGSRDWYTPQCVVDRARQVLGTIDLDPASSEEANRTIGARRILTEADDGLIARWVDWGGDPITVYLNPPGGRRAGVRSQALLFWARLMETLAEGNLRHAIFLAFNAELLQVSQGRAHLPIGAFPICAPARRLQLVRPGGQPGTSPTHSNLIVYVPGSVDRRWKFCDAFADLGSILLPGCAP